jgi:hypothetical protein
VSVLFVHFMGAGILCSCAHGPFGRYPWTSRVSQHSLMSDTPEGRRISDLNHDALVETLSHLEQLQATAVERGDLVRSEVLGRIAKDYRAELERRDMRDVAGPG